MRRLILAASAAMLVVPGFAAPAFAQHGGSPEYQRDDEYSEESGGKDAYHEDEAPEHDAYDHRDEAPEDERDYEGQTWRGDDGRLYCRRSDGTTGTIIGGGAGALIGRGIDTRGERGTGTIIGAIAGALIGRAIERGARCR